VAQQIYTRKELQQGDDLALETPKQLRVVYRDVLNLKYLYYMLHDWFLDNGWVTSREDPDFPETALIHRDLSFGGHIVFRWRFKKQSPTGALYRWHLDIDCQVLGLKSVETVVNGQKVKADSGEIEFFISPALYMTTSRWDKNPLLKVIKPILIKQVYRKQIQEEQRLYENELWRFQEALKSYFRLERYLPERAAPETMQKMNLTT